MNQLLGSATHRPVELLLWTLVVGSSVALLTTQYWALAPVPAIGLALLLILGSRPGFGFLLFVALLPFEGFTGLSAKYEFFTVSKLLGAFLVVMMAARMLVDRPSLSRLKSAVWPWLLALLAFGLLSALVSDYPGVAFNDLRRLVTGYLVFMLTCFYLDERDLGGTLPAILVGSVSLSSILSLLGGAMDLPYFVSGSGVGGEGLQRTIGAQTDANVFASTIVFTLPLLLHFLFSLQRASVRFLVLVLVAFNAAALILTYSRAGAMIAMVISSLFIALRLRRFRPHHLPVVLLGVIAVITALMALVPSSYWERQMAVTRPEVDTAISRRLSYLAFGWEAFQEKPVLGSGLGSFQHLYARSPYGTAFAKEGRPLQRAAHNSFVEIAVGTGALGFAAFSILLFGIFRSFLRGRSAALERNWQASDLRTAYLLAFLSIVLFSLFLSNLYVEYFWISLGISQIGLRGGARD